MADIWYFADSNGTIGPLSLEKLKNKLKSVPSEIDALVWSPNFSEWKKIIEVEELRIPSVAPPPLPPPFRSATSAAENIDKEIAASSEETLSYNPFSAIFVTLVSSYFVITYITPNVHNAFLLVVVNWVYLLFMMISGFILFRVKSSWKYPCASLFAFLPLFSLPGMYLTDEKQTIIHAGFALVGFLLGVFTGQALNRR